MSADRILDYQLTCIGGLEDVAADELRQLLGSRMQGLRIERGEVGRLHFRTQASPRRLLELQCPTAVEAVARQAHDVTVGQPGLRRILDVLRRLPTDTVRRLAVACDAELVPDRVLLRVTLSGAHRFSAADVQGEAESILQSQGFRPVTDESRCLRLTIRVQGKRVLISVHLGPRRRLGDPLTEGWPGPAEHSVRRLLDLDTDLPIASIPVAGIPAPGGRRTGLTLHQAASRATLTTIAGYGQLPLPTGALPVVLLMPDSDRPDAILREAVRAVRPGGIVVVLVRRPEIFAPHLHALGLPLEVMASLPFYVRRRRCALFLLERLELLGIELA